ncbi:MAG: stage III sporulation protein AA [Clostridia bacterium]|nr:stage III sporulation protein AA [Clostridia bacterium]
MSVIRENSESIEEVLSSYLPDRIRKAVMGMKRDRLYELEELRIRGGLPLMGVFAGDDQFIGADGTLWDNPRFALMVSAAEMKDLFCLLCEQSIYAYQEDISRGFITLKGGHRAGICGTVVYEGDRIKGMRDISSVCLRLSRQIRNCAKDIMEYILRDGADIYNTLILSPPRCGKTTLLRDLCRQISYGYGTFRGLRTAVIDERSELAASFRGVPQNDMGPRTDILDGCRKSEGIELVLRGMAPHVIVVDELGTMKDAEAVRMAWNAGVRLVATAHAFSLEDFNKRFFNANPVLQDGFERIVLLGIRNGKRWTRVMDTNGKQYYTSDEGNRMPHDLRRLHSNRDEALSEASGEAACTSKAFGKPFKP